MFKLCPVCDEQNDANNMVCSECGADISGVMPHGAPNNSPKETEKPVKEAPQNKPVKHCPVCGTKNDGDAMLCACCATDISSVSAEQAHVLIIKHEKFSIKITDSATIGRSDCPELSSFPTISRRHAEITFSNGEWLIKDIGSTNGTFINGVKIAANEPCPLKDGDKLQISKSCAVEVCIA